MRLPLNQSILIRAGKKKSGPLVTLSYPGATTGTEKVQLQTSSDSSVVHVNSQTGDDSTGDGSQANPYKSLSKADSEIAGSAGALTHIEWQTADDITEKINNNLQTSIGVAPEYTHRESNLALSSTPSFGSSVVKGVATDGNSNWVAVGQSGKIAYSNDNGDTWTQASSTTFGANSVEGIATDGNGLWVAVGNQGKIAFSNDAGVTWTAASTPSFGTTLINRVATDGTNWVAVGQSGKIAESSDGDIWTQASSPGFGTDSVQCIATDGSGKWAAGSAGGDIRTSTDRDTWTGATLTGFSGTESFKGIATDKNSNWVVVYLDGSSTESGTSTDNADNWSVSGGLGAGVDVWDVFTDEAGRWYSVGEEQKIWLSIDIGDTWSTQSNPFTGSAPAVRGGATDKNENYVYVAEGGEIAFGDEFAPIAGDEIGGVIINSRVDFSGASIKTQNMEIHSDSRTAIDTTLDLTMQATRVTGTGTLIDIDSNNYSITDTLLSTLSGQDVLVGTQNPSGTADVVWAKNTFIGNVDVINGSAAADGFQIRDNIMESDIEFTNTTDKPTFESGNIRGSVFTNAVTSTQITSTNPLFADAVDYKLQREADDFDFDSPLVKAAVFFDRPDGVNRDLGAWSIDDSGVTDIFQRAHYLAKPRQPDAIQFELDTRENLQLGINSDPTVYNDPNRHLERVTLRYGSLRREDHDFLRYAYQQRNRGVFLAIDPHEFIDIPDLTVDGNQSAGTPTVDIVAATVIEGSIVTIGGKKYHVVYPFPIPTNATGIVLDRPLEDDVSDTDNIAVSYPLGTGEYELFLNQPDRYTRKDQNEKEFRSGIIITLIRRVN